MCTLRCGTSVLILLLTLMPAGAEEVAAAGVAVEKIEYAPAEKLCVLENRQVRESSGMACSRRYKDVFWTHNDSGDSAVVYAFDATGKNLGAFKIAGAKAIDWEDMASFKLGTKSFLLLADIGDNYLRRKTCDIYIVSEPELRGKPKPSKAELEIVLRITFTYEDGSHNCESVAVDTKERRIYLVTKGIPPKAGLYELPLPRKSPAGVLKAKMIASVPMTVATGMDISPDGTRAMVVTYADAREFVRRGDENWAKAFSRMPRIIPMPKRRQGESICYGIDGRTLYLTSEYLPTPLWRAKATVNPRP